eukprot:jgi/Picre1/29146/NNA_004539.t1
MNHPHPHSVPGRGSHASHDKIEEVTHLSVKGGSIKATLGSHATHMCPCVHENRQARWNNIPKATQEDFKGTQWLRMVKASCHGDRPLDTVTFHLDPGAQTDSLRFALKVMFHQLHRLNYQPTLNNLRRKMTPGDRRDFDQCLHASDLSVRKGSEAYFIKEFQVLDVFWLSKPRPETNYVGIYVICFPNIMGMVFRMSLGGDCFIGKAKYRDYVFEPDIAESRMMPFTELLDLTWVDIDRDFHEGIMLQMDALKWNASQPCLIRCNYTIEQKLQIVQRSRVNSYKTAGNGYIKKGEYDKAEKEYTKALSEYPMFLSARNNRALAHLKLGNYDDAVCDGRLILEIDPLNDRALMRVATGLKALGDGTSAEKMLRDFLSSPDVSDIEKVPVRKKLKEIIET